VHGASSAASPGIKTGAEVSADYKGVVELTPTSAAASPRKESGRRRRRKGGERAVSERTRGQRWE